MSDAPTPHTARTIATGTHGRYLLSLPEERDPRRVRGGRYPLLLGCHGYAENAETHLAALAAIPGSERWALCAVQALSRFYERRSGAVIAGWMTSQDRELAIADNVAYVGAVAHAVLAEPWANGRLAYAGFSQGVAMAYRAAAFAGVEAAGLVALAGDVPPDVLVAGLPRLPALLIGTGDGDAWYTPARLEDDRAQLAERGVAAETFVFAGGHVWTAEFQAVAGNFLSRVLDAA